MSRNSTARAAVTIKAVVLSVAIQGCASRLFLQAQHVVVTGVPSKVAHCHAVGNVDVDVPSDDFDDRMLSLRENAVLRGANTVLVMSPATSVNGIAYQCAIAVKPDDAT